MVELQRIITDEHRRRRALRHGVSGRERPHLIRRRGIITAVQNDLQQHMGRGRLVREQDALCPDLLCRHTAHEEHAPHVTVRGDAHIGQDEQILRMARIGDRRHPRHIEILRLKPIVQLRGHGTQDIQPLRRPMRERIRQRQYIEKRYMTHARHHAQPPPFRVTPLL